MRARLSPFPPMAAAYHEANELGSVARDLQQLRTLRRKSGPAPKILKFEHHLCHAANSFYLSPFERALVLTLDQEGDGNAGLIAVGEGTRLQVVRAIPFPHSIAWIYAQTTALLGF